MGKYSHIAATLTPRPDASPYQERVNDEKRTITDLSLSEADLAKQLITVRAERDKIKDHLASITVRQTAYEQLISDAFEAAGVTSVKLDTGDTVSTQIKPYARIADKSAFRAWCVANGYEDALALPWQTTNQLVADRLVEGLPEPDGIDTYKQTTVILRRG